RPPSMCGRCLNRERAQNAGTECRYPETTVGGADRACPSAAQRATTLGDLLTEGNRDSHPAAPPPGTGVREPGTQGPCPGRADNPAAAPAQRAGPAGMSLDPNAAVTLGQSPLARQPATLVS